MRQDVCYRDEYGRLVPPGLAASFAAKETLVRWIDYMIGMDELLGREAQHVPGIPKEEIHSRLRSCCEDVLEQLPSVLCICNKRDSCKFCDGRGYLTRSDIGVMMAIMAGKADDTKWKQVQEASRRESAARSKIVDGCSLQEVRDYVASMLLSPGGWSRRSVEGILLQRLRTSQLAEELRLKEMLGLESGEPPVAEDAET